MQACTCMYIYIYACMHVCMYACMHVCEYACMHAYMNVCMHACMHVQYVCMCLIIQTYMHRADTCICIICIYYAYNIQNYLILYSSNCIFIMYAQRFYVLIETSRHGDPLQLFTTFPFGPGPHVAWRIFAGLRSKRPKAPATDPGRGYFTRKQPGNDISDRCCLLCGN